MKRLLFTMLLTIITAALFAQNKYRASAITIKMEGTSTLHDWHMTSQEAVTNVSFNFNGSSLSAMPSLTFTIPVETLKSGTKALNKNAYKALNSGKYPAITFTSGYANIRSEGPNKYTMNVQGKLNIAGVTRDVVLVVGCQVNPANMTIETSGSCKIKMTDYKVEPPSFMFGAMRTGDEVVVKFNATLSK